MSWPGMVLLIHVLQAGVLGLESKFSQGLLRIEHINCAGNSVTLPHPTQPDDWDLSEWSFREGDTKILCCGAAVSQPLVTASISWHYYKSKDSFGGTATNLKTEGRFSIRSENSGSLYSYLEIVNVTKTDAGFYMCKVSASTAAQSSGIQPLRVAKFLQPFVIEVFTKSIMFADELHPNKVFVTSLVELSYKLKQYDPECKLNVTVYTDDTMFQYVDIPQQQIIVVGLNPPPNGAQENFFGKFTVVVKCDREEVALEREWSLSGAPKSLEKVIIRDSLPFEGGMDTPYQYDVSGTCDKFSWQIVVTTSEPNEMKPMELGFTRFSDSYTTLDTDVDNIVVSYRFIETGSPTTADLQSKNLLIELQFSKTKDHYKDIKEIELSVGCLEPFQKPTHHSTFSFRGLPVFEYGDGNCIQKDAIGTAVFGPKNRNQLPCCEVQAGGYTTNLWLNGRLVQDTLDYAIPSYFQSSVGLPYDWYASNSGFYQCYVSGYVNRAVNSRTVESKQFVMNFKSTQSIMKILDIRAEDQRAFLPSNDSDTLRDVSEYIRLLAPQKWDTTYKVDIEFITVLGACMKLKISGKNYPGANFLWRSNETSNYPLYKTQTCAGTPDIQQQNINTYQFDPYNEVKTTSEVYLKIENTDTQIYAIFKEEKRSEKDEKEAIEKSRIINITGLRPYLKEPNVTKTENIQNVISIVCRVDGYPIDYVNLYAKDRPLAVEHWPAAEREKAEKGVLLKEITVTLRALSNGDYVCEAHNPLTDETRSTTIKISDLVTGFNTLLIVACVAGLIVLLFLVYIIWVCVRMSRYRGSKLRDVMCCINGYAPIEKIPLHDKYRLVGSTLNPGHTLGEGHFGKVVRGWSRHLPDRKEEKVDIAIKSVKPCGDRLKREADLYTERDLMMRVIGHRNVLQCYGYTDEPDPVSLVLEFAEFGSLDKLLANARTSKCDGYMAPNETLDDAIVSFEPHHIINFGNQIAEGMEYIGSKDIVHRDLAARNIVVSGSREEYIPKITDFGLARDVRDTDGIYERNVGKEIPIKWIAPECFNDQYTVKSDVWSYGVTLWELCTLGGEPYAGIPNSEIKETLRGGERLIRPPGCHKDLYSLMMLCWELDYERRPSFTDILTEFNTYTSSPNTYMETSMLYEDTLDLTLKMGTLGGPSTSNCEDKRNSQLSNDYTEDPSAQLNV